MSNVRQLGHAHMLNIRPYSPSDYTACMSIFRSNVPTYFSPQEESSFSEFLTDSKAMLVCGEQEGRVVAFGGYYVKGSIGRLCWGMVHSGSHRRGFGTELLGARMQGLLQRPEVQVIQATTSQHSAGFFSRLGFEQQSVVEKGHAVGLHVIEMQCIAASNQQSPNPSIERTALSQLRCLKSAAHVER